MLYQAMLIGYFVAHFLVTDIRDYCSLIHTYRTDKIACAPEMTIPIFVLQVSMTIKDHQGTFPFQISHKLRYDQIWWNTY